MNVRRIATSVMYMSQSLAVRCSPRDSRHSAEATLSCDIESDNRASCRGRMSSETCLRR